MKFIVLFLLTSPLFAQYVKVANEGDNFAASTLPVTVRFGIGTTFNAPVTYTKATGTLQVSNAQLGPDPAPTKVKELDVLQTAVAQTIIVNGQAKTVPAAVVVPPIIPPVIPPIIPVSCTSGTATIFTPNISVSYNAAGFIVGVVVGYTCK